MDWSVNSIQYLALKEVHGTFLECFLNTAANFAKKNDGNQHLFCTQFLMANPTVSVKINLSESHVSPQKAQPKTLRIPSQI